MNKKLLLLVTAGVATAMFASRRRNALPASGRSFDRASRPMASTHAADGSEGFDADSDVLALLQTLDEQTLALAEQALARTADARVQNFAQLLYTAHTDNLAATQAFDVDIIANQEVTELREAHEARLDSLATLDDEAFDRNFVDAVIQAHDRGIELLDQLLPDVEDDDVRQHVVAARAHLAQHLQAGRQLRENGLV